jgi:hypothetical protein
MIRSERSAPRVRRRAVAVLSAALLAAVAFPAPAVDATPLDGDYTDPSGITLSPPMVTGSLVTYVMTVDCTLVGDVVQRPFARAEAGKQYRVRVRVIKPPVSPRYCDVFSTTASGSSPIDEIRGDKTVWRTDPTTLVQTTLRVPADPNAPFEIYEVDYDVDFSSSALPLIIRVRLGEVSFGGTPPPLQETILILQPPLGGSNNSGGGQEGEDPLAADVATAVAQSTAAGVAGTSSGLLVRGGAVVPVSSSLASGVGPRGGVVLEADGLTVSVASAVGARPGSGVVVPTGGSLECSLCGDFVPGSVVEAWVNSDPRLAAAVRIPADAEDGDCHLLAVPTGAPLDGGGPIEAGEHTLQLRMYTQDGFAVLSTGITIGGVSPTGVPAGEGSSPLSGALGALLLMLAASGLGLGALRSQTVRD